MRIKLSSKRHLAILSSIGTVAVVAGAVLLPTLTSAANPVVRQGTTSTYAVLAASTITNTGATTISGTAGSDVGLSPGTSYTGSGTVTRSGIGVDHITDAAAIIAQNDLTVAFGDLAVPTPTVLAAPDLATQTLSPGTYSTAAGTFSNSGVLTLNAGGDASAVFIFQAASTVITGSASSMVLSGGAQACNVFWRVGSSATIGSGSTFVGHIYAEISIGADSGATVYGNLLARTAAVTLNNTTIVNNSCVTPAPAVTPVEVPIPPQDSTITSISSSECTTTSDYTVYITGTFPSQIANVAVDSVNIATSRWVQTPTRIEVSIPASSKKTFAVALYNGRVPLMPAQVFICTVPVVEVVVTPTPTPTPEAVATETPTPEVTIAAGETITETGGELPETGTNNFNYLLLGVVLLSLGAGGFLMRQRLQK
jgi:type VI secretion system secreted protein VgrG